MKLYKCYLVDCVKGPAIFLDHTKALEYVGKHGGILVTMTGSINHVQTPQHNSSNIRQEGQASEPRAQLIHEDPPDTSQSSTSNGQPSKDILACGDSGIGAYKGLEQALQACNDPVQCSGPSC